MTLQKQPTMISCDNCGCADYYFGSDSSVVAQAKEQGWLETSINKVKKHFCDVECLEQYKQNGGSEWDGR